MVGVRIVQAGSCKHAAVAKLHGLQTRAFAQHVRKSQAVFRHDPLVEVHVVQVGAVIEHIAHVKSSRDGPPANISGIAQAVSSVAFRKHACEILNRFHIPVTYTCKRVQLISVIEHGRQVGRRGKRPIRHARKGGKLRAAAEHLAEIACVRWIHKRTIEFGKLGIAFEPACRVRHAHVADGDDLGCVGGCRFGSVP